MTTTRDLLPLLKESDFSRFFDKVEAAGPCWQWTGASQNGYGKFRVGGRAGFTANAHRVSWTLLMGTEPGETLDHVCRNPSCVNPDHLESVARGVNVKRGYHRPKKVPIQCPNGHLIVGDNLRIRKNGKRECVPCVRKQKLASYHRNKHKHATIKE